MDYIEHPPPPDLQRHVQCLWVLRDETPGDEVQVIYPDGCCELLAELGVPLRFHGADGQVRSDQPFCFAAQQLGPIRLQAAGPVLCIGVRLMPASSALVAGARLPGLRDHAPDLFTLDPPFAARFRDAMQAHVATQSPEPLWRLLRERCAGFAADTLIERAVAMPEPPSPNRATRLPENVVAGIIERALTAASTWKGRSGPASPRRSRSG